MDSLSLSNTISKQTVLENTSMTYASLEDAKRRENDAISNERIKNGDTILDTYEVTSDAISGGMGSVWRVHHQSWNTDLAMKRPQPRFFAEGSDKRKEQFIAECENWINLGLHPNIVSCYYVREIGGVPTIFSEWMDGGSLKDRIADGALYEGTEDKVQERILDIAIQAARGLQYSHENGLIHQDFKPGNLLLNKEWDAKIADFGLAKAKSNLNDKSDTAKTTGYTLAYCPQEQADREEPQKWMDVYSWALTVIEMYAGKRLWDIGAEAKEHFDEYWQKCKYTVPDKMQVILKTCLTDKPDGFEGFIYELYMIYKSVIGAGYPRKTIILADVADSINNRALSFIDLGKEKEAEKLWDEAIRVSPNHLASVYNQSLYQWRKGEITDAAMVERCTLSAKFKPSDEFSSRWLSQIDAERGVDTAAMHEPKILKGKAASFIELGLVNLDRFQISKDGEYIYCIEYNGNAQYNKLMKRHTATLECVYCISVETGEFCSLQLSRDGLYLVADIFENEINSYLCVFESETGKQICRIKKKGKWLSGYCLHPYLNYCYTIGDDNKIYKWNYLTNKCEKVVTAQSGLTLKNCRVSPDGKDLCVFGEMTYPGNSESDYIIKIWDTDSLEDKTRRIHQSRNNADYILVRLYWNKFAQNHITYSPDGALLYVHDDHNFEIKTTDHYWSVGKKWNKSMKGDYLWIKPDNTRFLIGGLNHENEKNVSGHFQLWDAENQRLLYSYDKDTSENGLLGLTATDDLSLIVAQYNSGKLYIQDFHHTEPKPAPWELSEIKSYRQVMMIEEKVKLAERQIKDAVKAGDISRALDLLDRAEHEYDVYSFFPLYRQISRFCKQGKLLSSFEYSTMQWNDKWNNYNDTMCFVPNDDRFSLRNMQESSVEIYDINFEKTSRLKVSDHLFNISRMMYSHNGRLLAVFACDKQDEQEEGKKEYYDYLQIWDTKKKEKLYEYENSCGFEYMAFSPNDGLLACLCNDKLIFIDMKSGKFIREIECLEDIISDEYSSPLPRALCFTPNGKNIVLYLYCRRRNDNSEALCLLVLSCDLLKKTADVADVVRKSGYHYGKLTPIPMSNLILVTDNPSVVHEHYICSVYDSVTWEKLYLFDEKREKTLKSDFDDWAVRNRTSFKEMTKPDKFSSDRCLAISKQEDQIILTAFRWELSFPGWKDWDDEADQGLGLFLDVYPSPSEEQIQGFLQTLKNSGFGFIRPEGARTKIREEIEKRNKIDQITESIRTSIERRDICGASRMLIEAEVKYDPRRFFSIRKALSACCLNGRLIDIYELKCFHICMLTSWEKKYPPEIIPYPDPRGERCSLLKGALVYIYNECGYNVTRLELTDWASDICYSHAGDMIVAGYEGHIIAWDIDKKKELWSINVNPEETDLPYAEDEEVARSRVAFSPDDSLLAAGLGGGNIWLWDLKNSGSGSAAFRIDDMSDVISIAFSPTEERLFALDLKGNIIWLDYKASKDNLRRINIHSPADQIYRFVISPDGTKLFCAKEKAIDIWSIREGKMIGSFKSYDDSCRGDICISPDGTMIATYGSAGIRIWSTDDYRMIGEIANPVSSEDTKIIIKHKNLAFSPDGCVLYMNEWNRVHTYVLRRMLIIPLQSERSEQEQSENPMSELNEV